MNIVVCLKQVPDVDNIKWTKENNLDRTNMLSKLNSYDDMALNWAADIKKRLPNVHITAISMGPNQAKDILNYALAMGADRAILLSDRLFAASDTLITSKILSAAIKKYIPDFDLILTGLVACDGDTGQVPVSLSVMLNILEYTHIVEINEVDEDKITFSKKTNNEITTFKSSYPLLLSVSSYDKKTLDLKIDSYIHAQDIPIEIVGADDLGLNKEEIGMQGSPTMVYKAFRPDFLRQGIEIKENISNCVVNFIKEEAND